MRSILAASTSVLKVTHAGEDHRDAILIAGVDGVLIADAAARLDDAGDARLCAGLHAIVILVVANI